MSTIQFIALPRTLVYRVSTIMLQIGLALAALALPAAIVGAQQPSGHPAGHGTHGSPAAAPPRGAGAGAREHGSTASVEHGAEAAMSDGGHHAAMSGHMRFTPRRPIAAGDSARAAAAVRVIRDSLARYRDVKAAVRDGYVQFLPGVKNQRVYHFTNKRSAFREHFRFNVARPTSLLYREDSAGRMVLTGAMYVAPKRASLKDLDARLPVSIAQWHAHTNVCVPGSGDRGRWKETRGERMLFGPTGAIITAQECAREDGRFHEQLFGWMVHVNAFETNDPAKIWEP